jgi:hypothetical protein
MGVTKEASFEKLFQVSWTTAGNSAANQIIWAIAVESWKRKRNQLSGAA